MGAISPISVGGEQEIIKLPTDADVQVGREYYLLTKILQMKRKFINKVESGDVKMIKEIVERRSVRKYRSESVPKELIEKILKAGILAPSSKNRQPWKFIVTTGKSKDEMTEVMRSGLEREKETPFLPESAEYLSGAEYTLKIMRQAPVVIFIVNRIGVDMQDTLTLDERISEICNAQSIGAAIENMTLEAAALGLGSLWICDTYFAYPDLMKWLNTEGELYAALAIGYADEAPKARPRRSMEETVEWRV